MAAVGVGGFVVGLLVARIRLRDRHRLRLTVTFERDDDRTTEPNS